YHPVAWPRPFTTVRDAVHLGWHVVVARVAWYAYSNADFVVVGRMLGPDALGAYTVAWIIASIPVDRLTALVTQVAPPVLSAVQDDPAAVRRYVLSLVRGIAFVTFPAAAGLALVADEFSAVALGAQWQASSIPLRLLALSTITR